MEEEDVFESRVAEPVEQEHGSSTEAEKNEGDGGIWLHFCLKIFVKWRLDPWKCESLKMALWMWLGTKDR